MSQTRVEHTTSIESQDPNNEPEQKVKSRRPANTAFRQQRLKAWQPILTPKTVLPLFFIIGIIFAPIGGLLLYASSQVEEIVIDYTDCLNSPWGETPPADAYVPSYTSHFKGGSSPAPTWSHFNTSVSYYRGRYVANGTNDDAFQVPDTQMCVLQFVIPNPLNPPVLFYYRLSNFYQNHRRYVKSLDTNQLSGTNRSAYDIYHGSCDPLNNVNGSSTGIPYYPCGLIANSMFNDTFFPPQDLNPANSVSAEGAIYNMTNVGIAWSSDSKLYGLSQYTHDQVAVPPNWATRWPNGTYTQNNGLPTLPDWEEFQVWMRTAGLPTFSKLALRNDTGTMPAGTYQVNITMNFPVSLYGGTKEIVISTHSVMGGRNSYLGIAYVVVGGLCIVLGVAFTIAHLIKPRKLGDHNYLSWNTEGPSTGTATGVSRPGHDTA